ncbi:MAG: rod shape-determining protein MreC [Bacteroidales bacterium]|nr:rod shape-determining protein MreC [Bacteroidales bacterium]
MKRQRLLPRFLNLAVFIVLEIAALQMVTHNADLQRVWVARGAHVFMGKVWGASQNIRSYFSLSATNQELSEENFRLMQELEKTRERLREARVEGLDTLRRPGFSMVAAEVVKVSRNKQHNYLILNRGFEDGIQEKSGIITPNGVVGIIDAVSAHHAFAFSFQNSDISISARLGDEGGSGLLVWDGIRSNGAVLKEIPLQYRFQKGDTVYTSGHSLLFPPDIPLGIAGEAKVVNGATNEIAVRLFQDFSAIRYVSVVHNDAFDEIEQFEP